jgi:hypothetical protein
MYSLLSLLPPVNGLQVFYRRREGDTRAFNSPAIAPRLLSLLLNALNQAGSAGENKANGDQAKPIKPALCFLRYLL